MNVWRKIVEAFRRVFAEWRANRARSGAGAKRAGGTRRGSRRTPPRCDACTQFVTAMCPEGCGVCPACCPGHRQSRDGGGEQDGGKFTTSVERT